MLLDAGEVEEIPARVFLVKGLYYVVIPQIDTPHPNPSCDCEAHTICKHMIAVGIKLSKEVATISDKPQEESVMPKDPATTLVGDQLDGTANKLDLIDRLHALSDSYSARATQAVRRPDHSRADGKVALSHRLRALELEMRALEVAATL
jgi:uncharacterized Zn finger protein